MLAGTSARAQCPTTRPAAGLSPGTPVSRQKARDRKMLRTVAAVTGIGVCGHGGFNPDSANGAMKANPCSQNGYMV